MKGVGVTSATIAALILLSFSPLLSSPVSGQLGGNPNPGINLSCPDAPVEIDVSPGSNRIGTIYCILENPSIHQEDINITVEEIVPNASYPDSISVSPNSETTFGVSWSAGIDARVESFTTTIEATVTQVNGLPYPLGESKSESVSVEVLPFGRPWIDMVGQELAIEYGQSATVNFSLRNTGNAEDTISVTIENQSGLEEFGFLFDYSATSATLGVNESEDITITITADESISDATFAVILQVSSQLAEDGGNPWVVEENFHLQSLAKQESFLTTSVDNVPAWAITTALVLAGLAAVGVIVLAVRLAMSKRAGKAVSTDFDFDFDDDLDFDGEEFDDFELDDL